MLRKGDAEIIPLLGELLGTTREERYRVNYSNAHQRVLLGLAVVRAMVKFDEVVGLPPRNQWGPLTR